MTIEIGDIVQLHGRDGVWTTIAPYPSLNGESYFHFREKLEPGYPRGIVSAESSATLLHRPVFEAGMAVKYRGEDYQVISDLGERVRCVTPERRLPVGRYVISSGIAAAEIAKGELVSENMERLLRIEELETDNDEQP